MAKVGLGFVERTSRISDVKPHISCIPHRCFCQLPGHSSGNDADQRLASD